MFQSCEFLKTLPVIRHPKIRVLKKIVAHSRGLVDLSASAGATATTAAAAPLQHANSSESVGIKEVANQEWAFMQNSTVFHLNIMYHLPKHAGSKNVSSVLLGTISKKFTRVPCRAPCS